MMTRTLFTGVYPPSPPPRPDESYPDPDPEELDHDAPSIADSLDSSTSTIPPKPPRQPYSSRLKDQHLALSFLPPEIVPPSRETTPESWKRVDRIRDGMLDVLKQLRVERRAAESGSAYIGDHTNWLCTEFARCEWDMEPRRKRKRKSENEKAQVWDAGYGMGLPPLVDTDEEWRSWEKVYEVKKAESLAQANASREVERPVPRPVSRVTPSTGLGTKIENWRTTILPSSQPGSQGLMANSQTIPATPSTSSNKQSSQLSFKVVKKHESVTEGETKSGKARTRGELPPSVRIQDPLQDIRVESSQPELVHIKPRDEDVIDVDADPDLGAHRETQQTEESLRVISAYAAANPSKRLRLPYDKQPLSPHSAPTEFSTIQSWSLTREVPRDPPSQAFGASNKASLGRTVEAIDGPPAILAPMSQGSGEEIDISFANIPTSTQHAARPRAPELRLSELMHVEGEEVLEKSSLKSAGDSSKSGGDLWGLNEGDAPSFDGVGESTRFPAELPEQSNHDAEAPSFANLPTSTQFESADDKGKRKETRNPPAPIGKDVLRIFRIDSQKDGEEFNDEPSFRDVLHSTQPPRSRSTSREQVAKHASHAPAADGDPFVHLSFSQVQTSTQAPKFPVEQVDLPPQAPSLPLRNHQDEVLSSQLSRSQLYSPSASPATPSRRRVREFASGEDSATARGSSPSPSSPKKPRIETTNALIHTNTLTPPTTPSTRGLSAPGTPTNAKDVYKTPTSLKRLPNLVDLVRTKTPRPQFAALARTSPADSPSTPTRKSSKQRIEQSLSAQDSKFQVTPAMPDSPFSTPSSTVRRPMATEDSPPSLRKPYMARTASGLAGLGPQSSGLFGMDYNSQFQIEDNVEEVSRFLKNDVWAEDSP